MTTNPAATDPREEKRVSEGGNSGRRLAEGRDCRRHLLAPGARGGRDVDLLVRRERERESMASSASIILAKSASKSLGAMAGGRSPERRDEEAAAATVRMGGRRSRGAFEPGSGKDSRP